MSKAMDSQVLTLNLFWFCLDWSTKTKDIDNINVDFVSSHNIKFVPMDVYDDKNEILAMSNFKNFNKTLSKFQDVVSNAKKGKPLFQDLWLSKRNLIQMKSKRKRQYEPINYDYLLD